MKLTPEIIKALDTAEDMLKQIELLETYAGEIIGDYLGGWITKEEAEKKIEALGEDRI